MPKFRPTRKRLESKIRRMVHLGSGFSSRDKVIPGNENSPRPKDKFATVTLIDDKRHGLPYYKYYDDPDVTLDAREVMWELRIATYQIMYYGGKNIGASISEYPQNLQTWLISTEGILYQQRKGRDFIVDNHTDIREADHHVDLWEPRASMDIDIIYKRTTINPIGWIDQVDIHVHHRDNPSIDREVEIRP